MGTELMPRKTVQLVGVTVFLVSMSLGCATRGFVRNEVSGLRQDMNARTDRLEQETADVRNSSEQALRRAELAFGSAEKARLLALGHVSFREVSRHSLTFGFDSDQLDASGRSVLDEVAEMIRSRPDVVIDVYGFADPSGSASYNRVLGQRRADSVVTYLAGRTPGPVGRYAAVSFGESSPTGDAKSIVDSAAQQRKVVVSLFERTPPAEQEEPLPKGESTEFN